MKKSLLFLLFLLFFYSAYPQEVCNNGLDDDGNGLIDCFDGSCAGNSACPAFNIGSICSPTGGIRGDIIGVETAFVDVGSGTASFNIPPGAGRASLYIYSFSPDYTGADLSIIHSDEDILFMNATLDLSTETSSGFVNFIEYTVADRTLMYGWQNVNFGTNVKSMATGDVASVTDADYTITRSGSTLTVTEANPGFKSVYMIEFTEAVGNSLALLGTGSTDFGITKTSSTTVPYPTGGNTTANLTIPAGTDVIYLTAKSVVLQNKNNSAGGSEEGQGEKRIIIDLDAGKAYGYVAVNNGSQAQYRTLYSFEDHDITSTTNRLLDAPVIMGDYTGKNTTTDGQVSLSNPKLYVIGNTLTLERLPAFADDYTEVFTAEYFHRTGEGMASEFLDNQTKFEPLTRNKNTSFDIPAGAYFVVFKETANSQNSNVTYNENTAFAYAVIDLNSETSTGLYYYQVGLEGTTQRFNNYTWKSVPMDGVATTINHASTIGSILFPSGNGNESSVNFEISADKKVITVKNKIGHVDYQYIMSMDFYGSRPDLAFNPGNISFSKGATCKIVKATVELCNPGAGNNPAGIPVSFYEGDPTTDGTAKLLYTSSFDQIIPVGSCQTYDFDIDLSAYTDVNIDITMIINDDGSFVTGGIGTAVGTPFSLSDLVNQGNTFLECDFTNNKSSHTINVNNCAYVDLDGDNNSGGTGNNYITNYVAGSPGIGISDTDVTITEPDGGTLHSISITLTNRPDGDAAESLFVNGALPAGITASAYNSATGMITLTGPASSADFVAAILQIQYTNSDLTPFTTDRIVEIVVNDGVETGPVSLTTILIHTFPEIEVMGNGMVITNGDLSPILADFTDFGTVYMANTASQTFIIFNAGTGTINLAAGTPVTISGAHAGDFTVTLQPASPAIGSGTSVTFTIEFAPGADGLRTAVISIANDDTDENPYTFAIQGTGVTDNTPPTADIQNEPVAVANTNPYTVTIEFSEDVTGFTLSDLAVANGVASNLVQVDGNTWTADITPDGSGTITIDIAAGTVQDAAGNANTTAAQAVTLFDTTTPPSIPTVNNLINNNGLPIITGTWDQNNATDLTVTVNGVTYVLGTDPELTTDGSGNWTLDLSGATTPLSNGTYNVSVMNSNASGQANDATNDELIVDFPPVAVNDDGQTPENNTVVINVLVNDTDAGGNIVPSSVDLDPSSPGIQSTVTISGEGTYTVNTSTGEVTFVPVNGFSGTSTISYVVSDSNGSISNPATLTVIVTPANANADLAVTKTVSEGPYLVGATVVYTITVTNVGPGQATGVVVTDILSSSLSYTAFTTTAGTYNVVTGEWTIGILDLNDTETLQLEVALESGGLIQNIASVQANEYDPVTTNNETPPVEIQVIPESEFNISKGFSPNQDGNDDQWHITGIENFPGNKVTVFNRWGNLVFETRAYNNITNGWNGDSNGKFQIGTKSPDGTYFYIIDLGDGSKPIGGYVILKR